MTETANKAALQGRIDNFLYRQLSEGSAPYTLRNDVPVPTWNRFDLGFKLIYLDALQSGMTDFADRLYTAHINAFSLGDMAEPGNEKKVGIERFKSDFTAMLDDLRENGFDPNQSLAPLARDGSLLNAGHRAACAVALGIPLTGVETGLEPKCFDHLFFAKRAMAEDDLDAAALRLVDAMPDVAVALLWPAARGQDKQVEKLLGPLVYQKSVPLSLHGGHTLLATAYKDEPWLGDPAENYPGITSKLTACFNGSDALRVLVVDLPPNVDRIALKDQIRDLYGIGKSSVHITDTHAEAVEISQLLLNHNGRHFLEYGAPMRFRETRNNIADLQKYMTQNLLSSRDFAVDTGMVMGLYGLRPPSDIDVISGMDLPEGLIEQHGSQYRSVGPREVLNDPARHFIFMGVTFISLRDVAALKQKRLAGRDREDLLLIEPLLSQTGPAKNGKSISLRLRFLLLRLRRALIRFLLQTTIGLPLRRLYRRARGK